MEVQTEIQGAKPRVSDNVIERLDRNPNSKVSSEFRNEKKQVKAKEPRFPKIKKEVDKKAEILAFAELALPFHPKHLDDPTWNINNKYRPSVTPEAMIKSLQELAMNDPELKERLLERTNISPSDWIISDPNEITDVSLEIMRKYKVPVIFTLNTIKCRLPQVIGGDPKKARFGRDYILELVRDEETGEIIGYKSGGKIIEGKPKILDVARLCAGMAYEAMSMYDKEMEQSEKPKSAEDQKSDKRDLRDKLMKVTFDEPSNYALVMELPVNRQMAIDTSKVAFQGTTVEDIKKLVRIMKYNTTEREQIEEINGTVKDHALNYYEFSMHCPSNKEVVNLRTKYSSSNVMGLIKDKEDFDNAIAELFNGEHDLEKTVIKSTYLRDFTPALDMAVLDAMASPDVLDLESPYLTKEVVERNKEIIAEIFGDEASELFIKYELEELPVSGNEEVLKDKVALKDFGDIELEDVDMIDDDEDEEE